MNIRDLSYIVAVAEHKHFGQAAQVCHVSQPALSSQILKLEDMLGIKLFERSRRKVKTTPEGQEIINRARDILVLVDEIKGIAQSALDPFSGHLNLGMIPTIGPYLTPILLPSIAHGLPQLDLSVSEALTETLETSLIEGDIDAAILATRFEDPRIDEIFLYDEPFWIALSQRHPLTVEELVDIKDVGSDELLLLEDGHCFRDQILSFCHTVLNSEPKYKTQKTSLETLLSLVGASRGVTLVPAMSLAGSWVTDSGIALRKEKSGDAMRSVSLAFRKTFPRRQLMERMADIVCAAVPDTVRPAKR